MTRVGYHGLHDLGSGIRGNGVRGTALRGTNYQVRAAVLYPPHVIARSQSVSQCDEATPSHHYQPEATPSPHHQLWRR